MGLIPIKEYPTFQAAYELHPQNGLSAEKLYVKTVLIVMDWLRGRVAEKGGDITPLGIYPGAGEYGAFSKEEMADLSSVSGYDIKTVSWASRSTWALRVIELSTKADNQSFNTEVTVRGLDDRVLLAARTVCREPVLEKRMDPADVMRLGFISHVLIFDPDIIVTEYGVSSGYPLGRGLSCINGKSNKDCDALGSELISNEDRQYPVVLLTRETADGLQESGVLEELLEKGKCLSYIVAVENSPQKLVRGRLGMDRLADEMAEGRKAAVITDAASGCKVKPFELFDEEGELRTPYFNGMCISLRDNTRSRDFDYHGIEFYSEVRQKKLLETLPKTEDPGKNAEIAAVIEGLQAELEDKARNGAILNEENERLMKKIGDLSEQNKKLSRENRKLEQLELELADRDNELKSGEARTAELEEKIAKAQNEKRELIERTRPLFDVPVKCTREELVSWIRSNYGDRLVLHERGEKSFLADKRPRDFNLFCRIMHYLYGFTLWMAENQGEGGLEAANEAVRAYDVMGDGLAVTQTGKEPLRHHPEDYRINISEVNPNAGDVTMNLHVSIGKGMDGDSVRIYLYYDSETGKSIIGYVYDHLDIGMK